MRKIWLVGAMIIINFCTSFAQENYKDTLTKEIKLIVDNDVFISLWRDQYYSSGLFFYYRYLIQNKERPFKIIRSFSFNHRMYTPQSLDWQTSEEFDRPYAGHLSFYFNHEFYIRKNHYIKSGIEIGLMGPQTHTGQIQENWHAFLGIQLPQGWKYQIGNSPIFNYYGTYAFRIVGNKYIDVISETSLNFGTAFTHFKEDILLRIGKLSNISSSMLFNGQLGSDLSENSRDIPIEGYIWYSPGYEYNFFNSTIEGNLSRNNSPHTEIPVKRIWQHRAGVALGWKKFDFIVTYYFRTKETLEAYAHQYVSIQLNSRF